MTDEFSTSGSTPRERTNNRRYLIEFALALAAYTLALIVAGALLDGDTITGAVSRGAVALLPVLPVIAAAWIMIRHLNRLDEYQQFIQYRALGISFAGTAVLTMGWSFLEDVGAPKLPTDAIWPLMCLFWCSATVWISRRHRIGG